MKFVNLQTSVSHFRVHISASISVRIAFNVEVPCLFFDKIKNTLEWFDFYSRQVWDFSAGHHFARIIFRFQSVQSVFSLQFESSSDGDVRDVWRLHATVVHLPLLYLYFFFKIFIAQKVSNIHLVTKDFKIVLLTSLLKLFLVGRVVGEGGRSVLLGLY